jgi:cytosine/adenosine deaminase-related metal-dependent hydrolase
MSSILLKNCFYIFLSAEDGSRRGEDILIRNNRISKIGADIAERADRIIDCSTCVVVPGFVNTHHHFYQTLTRRRYKTQSCLTGCYIFTKSGSIWTKKPFTILRCLPWRSC